MRGTFVLPGTASADGSLAFNPANANSPADAKPANDKPRVRLRVSADVLWCRRVQAIQPSNCMFQMTPGCVQVIVTDLATAKVVGTVSVPDPGIKVPEIHVHAMSPLYVRTATRQPASPLQGFE